MFAAIMFMIWLIIGAYTMVLTERISKAVFYCCWVTLLIYIIASTL